jgi:hypothetical protein
MLLNLKDKPVFHLFSSAEVKYNCKYSCFYVNKCF